MKEEIIHGLFKLTNLTSNKAGSSHFLSCIKIPISLCTTVDIPKAAYSYSTYCQESYTKQLSTAYSTVSVRLIAEPFSKAILGPKIVRAQQLKINNFGAPSEIHAYLYKKKSIFLTERI